MKTTLFLLLTFTGLLLLTGCQPPSPAAPGASASGKGLMAFMQYVETRPQLMIADLDASPREVSKITSSAEYSTSPHWSPDRSQIALIYLDDAGRPVELWISDLVKGKTRRLSDTPVSVVGDIQWTSDGKYIVWGGHQPNGSEMDIYRISVETGEVTDLTADSLVWDAFPACSPADGRIAFVSDRAEEGKATDNIWVMDGDGTNLQQLTFSKTNENKFPAWSPDGSEIAYIRFDPFPGLGESEGGPDGIWAVKTDGSKPRVVLEIADIRGSRGSEIEWSPDGRWIAFTMTRDGDQELFVVPTGGGEAKNLSGLPGNDAHISWSADSQYLVFTHWENDTFRLFLVNVDGSKPVPIFEDIYNFSAEFAHAR